MKYFFFREVGVLEAKVEVFRSQVEGRGEKVALQLEVYRYILFIPKNINVYNIRSHSYVFHWVCWIENQLL